MADQDWNGLPYGHFGNATYQSDEQIWQFERLPGLPRILEPIGTPEIAVPSSRFTLLKDGTNRGPEYQSIRFAKEAADLVKLVLSLIHI